MKSKIGLSLLVFVLAVVITVPAFAAPGGRPGSDIVVYVRSQGLYYDSIPGPSLPMKGRFQKLEMTASGLETNFGPGDQGYVGGRWWIDANGDGAMDDGDIFFVCPLLGPGRVTP
jgi:hypothetical protein